MRLLALVLAALLTGCAPTLYTTKSPGQVARLADGQTIQISGSIFSESIPGKVRRKLSIYINGDTVIDQPIPPINISGEFYGKWNDKAVAALCSSSQHGNQISVSCVVLINNERTVTLSFI